MLGEITDPPSSQVEQTRGTIWQCKEEVEKYETQANEQEVKLNQGLLLIYHPNTLNIILIFPTNSQIVAALLYTTVCSD